MRNKASLSLMEQLVMILVFSLAAALCLGVFARAQTISDDTLHRETAAQIAQNGAELLKAGEELTDLSLLEGYDIRFVPDEKTVPGLQKGTIEVWLPGEKEPIFALPAAWQEDLP